MYIIIFPLSLETFGAGAPTVLQVETFGVAIGLIYKLSIQRA